MPVERAAGGTSLVDVLDRVLDKGIVIDAWVRVSLVGIDLITVEARVVVASIDTYLKYAEAVGQVSTASRPALEAAPAEALGAETPLLERERERERAATTTPRSTTPRATPRRPATTRPRRREAHDVELMIQAEAKLALVEFLLSSVDASVCAQRGLEWLGTARRRRQGAAGDRRERPRPPLGHCRARHLAGADRRVRARPRRSSRSAGRRRLERHAGPFPSGPRQPETPLESVPFHAVPLRPDRDAAAARPSAPRRRRAGARRRRPLVRRDPRREVPGAAAAQRHRRSRHRPRTASALQHHQRGHRSDSADRRRPAS